MKIGFRIPSLTKRIAARTSVKRVIRHNMGLKAPRGMGWLTNPKKAAYNRMYNRTTRGCLLKLIGLVSIPLLFVAMLLFLNACTDTSDYSGRKATYVKSSIDYKGRYRKGYVRMPVSTKKNAIKNQNRSRYYYHTRGKYRRKSKRH
ncbi:MAG: hypothetical protein ACK45I_11920 [Bacteroidota bacterium]|jgi:hypothetical protein